MKLKSSIFLVISLLLLFSSCSNIQFKEPQPASIAAKKAIPKKFHGTFVNDEDTIIIEKQSIEVNIIMQLSDSFVIKKLKSKYFLNVYDQKKQTWRVMLFELTPEKHLKLTEIATENDTELQNVRKYMNLTKMKDADDKTYYLANPSKKQWKKMIRKQLFNNFKIYFRINEPSNN